MDAIEGKLGKISKKKQKSKQLQVQVHLHGGVIGQVGWDSGQPDLLGRNTAQSKGVKDQRSLRSLPT